MLLTDELLLNYKRCQRRTFLDIYGNPQQQEPEREFVLKLQRESQIHIATFLKELNLVYHRPSSPYQDRASRAEETEILMKQGVECIYNGVLTLDFRDWNLLFSDYPSTTNLDRVVLVGTPHLLIKQPGESKFGDWTYIPVNIKLGRRPKPEYKIIAAFHAALLTAIARTIPAKSIIILRPRSSYAVNLNTWLPRTQSLIFQCVQMLTSQEEPEVFISRQRCSLCHWYTHCYEKARSQKHLSLIPGVTPKRYESLQILGIDSLESLATISPLDLGESLGFDVASQLSLQARSLLHDRAILKSINKTIPTTDIELYFDIEAEPERNVDYLLGVLLVDRRENTEIFYSFLAEKPEDEREIWQQFLARVNSYKNAPIFHYSEYEVETVKRLGRLYQTPWSQIESLLSRFVDLHYSVTRSVILPVESYSLKSLANWLGFEWRDRGVNGEQSVCWYARWLESGDRSFLEAILRYNEDDCRATLHLKNWLVQFFQEC